MASSKDFSIVTKCLTMAENAVVAVLLFVSSPVFTDAKTKPLIYVFFFKAAASERAVAERAN